AVMCVPAHDERDYEFAEKYHLPVKIVVQPKTGVPLRLDRMSEAFTEYGRVVDSGPYDGLATEQAQEKMIADAQAKGFGAGETTYRLKDWGVSRQRYWGRRFRSCTAIKMELCRCRTISCRCVCRKMGRLRGRGSLPWAVRRNSLTPLVRGAVPPRG